MQLSIKAFIIAAMMQSTKPHGVSNTEPVPVAQFLTNEDVNRDGLRVLNTDPVLTYFCSEPLQRRCSEDAWRYIVIGSDLDSNQCLQLCINLGGFINDKPVTACEYNSIPAPGECYAVTSEPNVWVQYTPNPFPSARCYVSRGYSTCPVEPDPIDPEEPAPAPTCNFVGECDVEGYNYKMINADPNPTPLDLASCLQSCKDYEIDGVPPAGCEHESDTGLCFAVYGSAAIIGGMGFPPLLTCYKFDGECATPVPGPSETTKLGRYEIAHREVGNSFGAITEATEKKLSADVFIQHGTRVTEGMLTLELYGMIGAPPAAGGVPLKCEDGERISSATTNVDLEKASFELNLGDLTNDATDGNTIMVCASIVNKPVDVEVARLETIFEVKYTYESNEFSFDVNIADPAAVSLEDDKAFTIPVESFLCDENKKELSDPDAKGKIGQG